MESANVVGYAETAPPAGFLFYTPQFKNIDGSAIDIQQIEIDAATATSWADNVQIIEEVSGAVIESYYYATADESGFETNGWVNADVTGLAEVEIKEGTCVAIETAQESSIKGCGEVSAVGTPFDGQAGFTFLGNNTPKSINIQDIKLEKGKETSWVDNIQILDTAGSGAVTETYYYATKDESGFDSDGWVNADVTGLADVTLVPGEGFAIELGQDGTVTLPSAL